MADTIYLPDGEMRCIFSNKDYVDIFREKLGYELSKVFEDVITDLESQIIKVKDGTDTDIRNYENSLYSNTCAFSEISEQVEQIKLLITDSKRLDKNKVYDELTKIERIIDNRE